MSLGIKSSAFLRVEETDARKFEVQKGYRSVPAESAVPPSCRTGCPKDLGTNFSVPIVNLIVNTFSSKRLDAKRHYVILAKTLDGIWPVGHACAVLC